MCAFVWLGLQVGVTELYYFLSKEMVDVALTDEEER